MSVSRVSQSQRKLVQFNGAATVEELYRMRCCEQAYGQSGSTGQKPSGRIHKSVTVQYQAPRKLSREVMVPRKEFVLKEYYSQPPTPQVDSVLLLGGSGEKQSRFFFSFSAKKKRKPSKPLQTSHFFNRQASPATGSLGLRLPCEKIQIFSKTRDDLASFVKRQKPANVLILVEKKPSSQNTCKSSLIDEPESALNGWKTSLNLNQIWEQQYW